MNTKRQSWIDVAKLLGIFAIYTGHFRSAAGDDLVHFFYSYHVPLFFFLSGVVENFSEGDKIKFLPYVSKRFKALMIPLYFFALSSIFLFVLRENTPLKETYDLFLNVFKGVIRNTIIAGSVWFFSCLFVMSIFFYGMKKICHNKFVLFFIAISLHLFSKILIFKCGSQEPSWFFNIDSALYYIIYYVMGYILYPFISTTLESGRGKVWISASVSFIYAFLLFFGVDLLLCFNTGYWMETLVMPLIRSFILIWLNIVIAYALKDVAIFAQMGQETLYYCGSEWAIKYIIPLLFSLCGLTFGLYNRLNACLYTAFLFWILHVAVVPVEKRILDAIRESSAIKGKKKKETN